MVSEPGLTKLPPPTFNDVVSEVQGFEVKMQSYNEDTSTTAHLAYNTQKTSCSKPTSNNFRHTTQTTEGVVALAITVVVVATLPVVVVSINIRQAPLKVNAHNVRYVAELDTQL